MTNIRLFPRVLFLLLLTATVAVAQQDDTEPSPSPAVGPQTSATQLQQTQSLSSPSPTPQPKVVRALGRLELDDIVEVNIENLGKWVEAHENHDPAKLVPYLNGRAITGNYPDELHVDRGRLIYHLRITPENREVWIDLLGAPDSVRRPVTLSVGLENGSAFDSVHERENPLPLTVVSPAYGAVAAVIILVTLILLLWLVRKTSIIREPGPHPISGKKRPYNLGRAQMAFWFFLVYASYTTIWLITGALDTITASLLALMGISAGTALGEALIDNGKDTAKTNQVQELTAQKQAIEQAITDVQAQVNDVNAAGATTVTEQTNRDMMTRQLVEGRTRLGQIDLQLRTLAADSSPTVSSGFLRDILSDSSGYSFHRFQIFAWTIVLGIIFVSSVYNNLTMPEFSPTLLGLMGLSAGTYIGFKFPEQK
ncbi:MAG: hypothetical protein LC794_07905 [Acidobacteria bacterium]|nr:hypothetical protein [Acidobacteriota bacterium]